MNQTTARTELRIARSALSELRQDLITGAFALRPIPPLAADSPLLRRVPSRIRQYAVWAPHAALMLFAFFLMSASDSSSGSPDLLQALFSGVPLFVVLFRPVGAWWLSVAAVVVTAANTSDYESVYPTPATLFISYVVVMALVAARHRPRAAAEMWVVTVLVQAGFDLTDDGSGSNSLSMAFSSALVLAVIVVARGLRETKQQVAVQESVTAEERSRRTLLEERANIARELHDVVAHHMSVIAIQAEAAPYRVENPPEELAKSFATIRENAVVALTELRRVLGVVRAADPDSKGADAFAGADPEAPQPTLAALGSLLSNVRTAGLTVDHTTTGAVRPLPQGVELSAYRIVQEALSNVLRHSPGAAAHVEISYVLGGVGLRIVNGPPTEDVRPSPGLGHGVLGMRERVTMLDGEMTAGPVAEDGGYEVAVFIPVAGTEEA